MGHTISGAFGIGRLLALAALAPVACTSGTNNTAGGDGGDEGGVQVDPPVEDGGTVTPKDAAPFDAGPNPLPGCTVDPGPPAITVDPNSGADPAGGAAAFTLDKAMAGYPAGAGKLTAAIVTEMGIIKCELSEAAAPASVANFVGLARGTRPFKDGSGKWKVGRFFDGLIWHRVIPNFVIQGGDPDGVGTGGPGYDLIKENQIAEPLGTLAQAAAAQPSGSQFYVVVGTGPAPNYNVYGTCTTDVAIAIAAVETGRGDVPKVPVHMQRVVIARCP